MASHGKVENVSLNMLKNMKGMVKTIKRRNKKEFLVFLVKKYTYIFAKPLVKHPTLALHR